MKRPWWVKIFFDDFCSHFYAMNDEEIVKDIRDSVKALLEKNQQGTSFGAMMVREASSRVAQKSETYRQNVNQRWHPEIKIPVKDEIPPVAPSVQSIYDFARLHGLDEVDARDFYEMTFVERGGKDRDGNPVKNWQGMLKRFCQSREKKRMASYGT